MGPSRVFFQALREPVHFVASVLCRDFHSAQHPAMVAVIRDVSLVLLFLPFPSPSVLQSR